MLLSCLTVPKLCSHILFSFSNDGDQTLSKAAINTKANRKSDVIVLGAGVAGLAAASALAKTGRKVIVIDRASTAGGTHRSMNVGPYTFDVGSIFFEETSRLFDLMPQVRDDCPQVIRRQTRIGPEGQLLRYPIAVRDILDWPMSQRIRAVFDLFRHRFTVTADGGLENISIKRMGRTLYVATGLRDYICRFNHVSPAELDEDFFYKRMKFIQRATELRQMISALYKTLTARRNATKPTRKPLYIRPREGFDCLYDPIVAKLKAEGVEFAMSAQISKIARQGENYHVATQGTDFVASSLVSAIPVASLYKYLYGESAGLSSIDQIALFVSASNLSDAAGNLLFNFHPRGQWKRLTIYSRLYASDQTDREFFTAEVTVPSGHDPDVQAAFDDLKAHLEGLGFAQDLVLEGHEIVQDAYPLYLKGYGATLQHALDRIDQTGIVSVGRQGRFDYLPTSSAVLRQVAEELDKSGLL